jgi:hypothetical protein
VRRLWASHRVRGNTAGFHRRRHPVVGGFTSRYEVFCPPDAPDVVFGCQVADPGAPDEDALRLLASWTAETGPGAARAVPRAR